MGKTPAVRAVGNSTVLVLRVLTGTMKGLLFPTDLPGGTLGERSLGDWAWSTEEHAGWHKSQVRPRCGMLSLLWHKKRLDNAQI